MSLLDNNSDTFEIELFYKFVSLKKGKKLVILEDEKAQEIMNKDPNAIIEKLITTWRFPTWKEQNDIAAESSRVVDSLTGQKQFSYIHYRDSTIKKCLKGWNLTVNEKPVPVTPEAIDSLPGPIIMALYQKFEKVSEYTEDEVKN